MGRKDQELEARAQALRPIWWVSGGLQAFTGNRNKLPLRQGRACMAHRLQGVLQPGQDATA